MFLAQSITLTLVRVAGRAGRGRWWVELRLERQSNICANATGAVSSNISHGREGDLFSGTLIGRQRRAKAKEGRYTRHRHRWMDGQRTMGPPCRASEGERERGPRSAPRAPWRRIGQSLRQVRSHGERRRRWRIARPRHAARRRRRQPATSPAKEESRAARWEKCDPQSVLR